MKPRHAPPSAWTGHIPFAAWIVEELRPRVLVELGSHNGASYLGFCQAVKENALASKCFAVDTWQGDEHAGNYGEEVFAALNETNAAHYAEFSQLMRMTFDEALGYFADGSVDLLHIDGLHTYEAVRHDFETWLPKLSERGVILFHDTMVRERNFGVWKLWSELAGNYPSFEFQHAHGLGVLLVGKQLPDSVAGLPALADSDSGTAVLRLFDGLATRNEHYLQGEAAARTRHDFEQQLSACQALLAEANVQLGRADAYARAQLAQGESLAAQLAERDLRLQLLLQRTERQAAELDQLARELHDREQRLLALQERIEQAHAQFGEFDTALKAANAQLVAADGHAHASVAHTEQLMRELADRDQRLQAQQASQQQQAQEQESRNRTAAAALLAANARIAELEARVRALDASLDTAGRRLAEADRVTAQYQSLLDSRSWRWTGPMRKLLGLLRPGEK